MKKTVGFAAENEGNVEMNTLTNRKDKKKSKAPSGPGKNPEQEKHYWVANIRQNIKSFFKLNAPASLKREGLVADPDEQKETRGWLFFFIMIQIVVLVVYAFVMYYVNKPDAYKVAVILTIIPFGLKLLSIIFFFLERIFTCACFRRFRNFDPENPSSEYKEVAICIPVFHESKATLERTIRSIGASRYPKNKLYMFFIVDGNKANTFENLLDILRGDKKQNIVTVPNVNNVEHGVYITADKEEIYYSVFLKSENRGVRDCKWLFVEVLRNMNPEFRPHFTLFLASDTSIDADAIRALQFVLNTDVEKHGDSFDDPTKRRGAIAGVTGKIKIANFGAVSVHDSKWDNLLFNVSNVGLISVQYYDYNWNDVFTKRVEEAYNSVTCLPGAFSMFRTDILCDFDNNGVSYMRERDTSNSANGSNKELNEDEWVWVKKIKDSIDINSSLDYFAKPLNGFVERVTQELGQDRHLTVKLLEKGFHTRYEPKAVAYTEGPDTISALLQQRKRWNNSEFLNNVLMFFNWRVWIRIRTIPIQFLALFQVIGYYLLPVNSILVTFVVWNNFIRWGNEAFDLNLDTSLIIFWWVIIQVVVIISTKLNTSDMFYALVTFFTGIMMLGSIYFFVNYDLIPIGNDFSSKPNRNWAEFILVIIWPLLHIVVSIFNPLVFFMGIATYIFFPTLTFTFTVYSFFALDDYSWGTR